MHMSRGLAAARSLAIALVANHALVSRSSLLPQRRTPRVDEVLRDHAEAFALRNPFPSRLPRGGHRLTKEQGDASRDSEVEFAPRAHLPLLVRIELATQLDAGHPLRGGDHVLDVAIRRMRGHEPRLLVREPHIERAMPASAPREEPVEQDTGL